MDGGSRYQTVFARHTGAVAAPTAGYASTRPCWQNFRENGAELTFQLTCTLARRRFQPVRVRDLTEHRMHRERFEIPPSTIDAIASARALWRGVGCRHYRQCVRLKPLPGGELRARR